jgi:hypothetical protein
VNKATGNTKRKQMRESQTEGGAPNQPKDPAGDGDDILQCRQGGEQADGDIERHCPGLFA